MPRISHPPNIGNYRDSIRTKAITYIEAGLVLIPLKLWDKKPLTKWTQRSGQIHTMADFDRCEAKYMHFGLGLNCGESGVLAIDFDIRYKPSHEEAGITREQFNRWLIDNETLRMRLMTDDSARHAPVHSATEDDTAVSSGVNKTPVKVGGRHHFFSNPQGLGNTSGTPPQIDTRGVGGYIVLPPTVIQRSEAEGSTWHKYTVMSNPNYAVMPDAPQWLVDITHPKKATPPTPDTTPRQSQAQTLVLANITTTPHSTATSFDAQIAYDRAVVDSGTKGRNNAGLWLACQLRDGGLGYNNALQIMQRYQEHVTSPSDPYTIEEAVATCDSTYKRPKREPARYQGERRTIGHLGNNAVLMEAQATPQTATLEPRYDVAIFGKLALTDSGNADRFINATRGNVRYNESNKKWLIWSAIQWLASNTNRITAYGRRVAEYITVEADSVTSSCNSDTKEGANIIKAWTRHATASQSKRSIDAMVSLAMGNIGSVATDYDTHLDYLPCINGVIDLRNGTLLQHSRDMRYTKITHIEYDDTATCPQWLRFLGTITGGDHNLIDYLQMQVGYSLTGRTDQQALFFMYGNGANGKSTFMNTVAKLAGEYHTKINMEGIIDTENNGGASPHLVALHGMRLTSGSEFPAGKRINESMIKDLTGGDEITARALYSEPFTFRPINKFWLMGNYKPRITGTDNGIWRRLILIPFEHTIPEADRVPSSVIEAIFDKELAGILTWAVQGATKWYEHPQRASLPKPEAVTNAITEYRQEEDTLARFITEQCDMYTGAWCEIKEIMTAYHAWLEGQGERTNTWTQTRLSRELKRMDIVQDPGRRKYLGIRPRPQGNVIE
jgi:P4 family phage/plasmid primase-like protien